MVPSKELIAKRAYELWEENGRPENSAEKFWVLAETELESRFYAEEDNKPIPARAERDPNTETHRAASRGEIKKK